MAEVYFDGIQNIIIGRLKQAEKKVCIAVAWFTNEGIFTELITLLDKKVEISLVILDDYINNGPFGLDFSVFIDKGGKLFYSTFENPVHHKFCIIDESFVLSGSYNWTYYAEFKNYENEVLLTDKNYIEGYSNEFNKIIDTLVQKKEAIKYLEMLPSRLDIYSQKEYLANDILIRGINLNRLELIEQAKVINATNISFVQMASVKAQELKTNVKSVIPSNKVNFQQNMPPITKMAYGISSRIGDVNDRFAIILKKGENAPITQSSMFYTVNDNQTQISVDTYKGDNPQASKNLLLGKILIKDLPPLPAGKASIKVEFSIDIKGVLNVKVLSIQTGNSLEANYYNSI